MVNIKINITKYYYYLSNSNFQLCPKCFFFHQYHKAKFPYKIRFTLCTDMQDILVSDFGADNIDVHTLAFPYWKYLKGLLVYMLFIGNLDSYPDIVILQLKKLRVKNQVAKENTSQIGLSLSVICYLLLVELQGSTRRN